MRTYIRRLKNCGLQGGTVSVSAFKGVIPTKLFLCIWPTDPNIKNRAQFYIRKIDNNIVLVLRATTTTPTDKIILKFDKTANVFDDQGFFWTASKGHNFQIETVEIDDNDILFCADHINKNRFFLDMLQVIGICSEDEIAITEYLQKKFAVHEKIPMLLPSIFRWSSSETK